MPQAQTASHCGRCGRRTPNSKTYYVITDGLFLRSKIPVPIVKGNRVDAISNIRGLHQVASSGRWCRGVVSCPNGCSTRSSPQLVCYRADGRSRTNYRMPGDRIYIAGQPIIRTNNTLQKILAAQQLLGITLLGSDCEAISIVP